MHKRGSGVFLPIFSLPSPYGIGDIGKNAFQFIDFLVETRQSFWQVLPLNPTSLQGGNSPYSSSSARAYNPLLIDLDHLANEGLINKKELESITVESTSQVQYPYVTSIKFRLLRQAYSQIYKNHLKSYFEFFKFKYAYWLDDHALFMACKKTFNEKAWIDWDDSIKKRAPDALKKASKDFEELIDFEKFIQFLFWYQWDNLRSYAHRQGIQIIGDIPMFVGHDSVDTWVSPRSFKLNENFSPVYYAGVPPDQFSASGQNWHTPVYNWEALENDNFSWWINRFRRAFEIYDILRIDHFRGLVAYWEIPADKSSAQYGAWKSVPYDKLFDTIFRHFFCFPIIAEDLGYITCDIRDLIDKYSFPGMRVLLFGFSDNNQTHPYRPHMYPKNSIACTSTHDTSTLLGYLQELSEYEKTNICKYLGINFSTQEIYELLMRSVFLSHSDMLLIPLQDILALDNKARMNLPGSADNNWIWRFSYEMLTDQIRTRLADWTTLSGRG